MILLITFCSSPDKRFGDNLDEGQKCEEQDRNKEFMKVVTDILFCPCKELVDLNTTLLPQVNRLSPVS